MSHQLLQVQGNSNDSKNKLMHKGKRIKCKVHIVLTTKDKMSTIGTILVPIDNSAKFCGLVAAARQRIEKNKKYNQYTFNYTPDSLEIFIRDKTDQSLSVDYWSEIDWEDIISDLFDPSAEVVVFKFNNKPSIDPNENTDVDIIICRVFLKYNKQQQDDEKKQQYEKLGNDLNIKISKDNNSFVELVTATFNMLNNEYGKLENVCIYTTFIDDAVIDQIMDWGEMELTDELDLIDDDEIVAIVIEMQYENDNNAVDIGNQLPLKQMKTYLMMDKNNKSPSITVKVRYWNKRNELNEIQNNFNRNITVKQFKQQIARISGLSYRADLNPSLQFTPSQSCICNQVIHQPTENGKINFFYAPLGAAKGCTLTHIKLECDFDITVEQLRAQIIKTTSLNLSNMRLFGGNRNLTFIKKAKLSDLEFSSTASNILHCCNDEKMHSHPIVVQVEKYELGFKNTDGGDQSFENMTAIKSPNMNKSNAITIAAKSSDSIIFIKTLLEQKLKVPVAKQLIFHQSSKNGLQHIGNDYSLRDIGLTEKVSLIVASWNKPTNLAFDLFNHSHQLFDHDSSKLFEIFNFNQADILFVLPRYIFHKEAYLETYGKDKMRAYFGNIKDSTMKNALRLTASWMPFISQSRSGMSSFLSCLYLLSHSEIVTENKHKLLGHLRQLQPKISPFTNSMQILLDGNANQLTPAHKSALSNGCYKLFRQIIPMSAIANDKVFEYSHYIFWYLLRFVSDKFDRTEPFKEETLVCSFSTSYLVNPVMIPGDDKIYSYQSIRERINGGKLFDINNKKFAKLKIDEINIDYDTYLLLKVYPNCKTVSVWNWADLTKSVRKQIDNFEIKENEEKEDGRSWVQQQLALTWRQMTKYIYDTTKEVCTDCKKKDNKKESCIKCKKLNQRNIFSECMAMKPIDEHNDGTAALCYDTNGNKCVITKRLQNNDINEGHETMSI